MIPSKKEWTKAQILRPRDNIISHVHLHNPRIFKPSYEMDDCPIPISWLLGGEYGRIWLRERNEFIQKRVKKTKRKFIENDYENWIAKRQPKAYSSCTPQGHKRF